MVISLVYFKATLVGGNLSGLFKRFPLRRWVVISLVYFKATLVGGNLSGLIKDFPFVGGW